MNGRLHFFFGELLALLDQTLMPGHFLARADNLVAFGLPMGASRQTADTPGFKHRVDG